MSENNYSSSLQQRKVPQWYNDSKFGIFIHWGLYSVPAYAGKVGSITDNIKNNYDEAIPNSPYSEWYANSIKVPGSAAYKYHQENYLNKTYDDFKQPFEAALDNWNPSEWAALFKESGAKYVVLVSKHHDGYCLWPTSVNNPNKKNWQSRRDVIAELADAVRAQGLRFGLYYSGGIDWTFNPKPVHTVVDFFTSMPNGEYEKYALDHCKELIERYKPSVLWNDIAWPTNQKTLNSLFGYYYQNVNDGVVNDRWITTKLVSNAVQRYPILGRVADFFFKNFLKLFPSSLSGFVPPKVPHCDFRSPEYAKFDTIQKKKWEATRGMSHSFGYIAYEKENDYETPQTLLYDFIDGVSKNGNLLLNVGPRGIDAQLPVEQVSRLKYFGKWLSENGEAIYGTKPWTTAEAKTKEGVDIRITCNGMSVFLITMGKLKSNELTILKHEFNGAPQLISNTIAKVKSVTDKNCTILYFSEIPDSDAVVIKFPK